jgi:alkanesulfonate monooxygenase SsuD/methylene tetrahydromethanopterin reductase-like flavin-dependent oxidoreductase (luciferase family)
MRFGLFHTVQWPEGSRQPEMYEAAMREAVRADELGLYSVWLTEHHFSRHGIISDSLNVLSNLAARTSRIRLGTAVAVLPFHSPVRLAETAATVDVLSGGRLDFGIGRGYQPGEFAGFDVDMADRAARFEESLELIRRSWTSDHPFDHDGRFWRFGSVDPQPKPVQSPHPPIWMATDSEDGLRRCAQEDWGVMFPQGRSLEVVADQVARYQRALAEEGKTYDPAKVVLARGLYVDETDDRAWEVAGGPYVAFLERAARLARPPAGTTTPAAVNPFDTDVLQDAVVFGSPQSCVAQLRRIRDLGISYVLFFIRYSDMTHERIMTSLDRFAAEVAPELSPIEAVEA